MKSKTKIFKQTKRKKSQELAETILACKKNKSWKNIAEILSSPRRMKICVNLDEINEKIKEGDTIIVPGKVLSEGNVNKKIRIVALNFSEKAREKLKKTKSEVVNILDELKINPKFQGVKIIR
jgi:large subunit ribosomal protein L18e